MPRFFVLLKNRPGLACVHAFIDITITRICSCMCKQFEQILVKFLVILSNLQKNNKIESEDIAKQLEILNSNLMLMIEKL